MRRRKLTLTIAAAIAFLIGLVSTLRSAPADPPQRFDLKVRQDFFSGFAGDREALARGMKASEEALAANPKNAEALVWHGSGVLFGASDAFQAGDQAKGTQQWSQGLKEMQTAVELDPNNVAVRIPRGATLLASSRFLPSSEMARPLIATAVSDYERTLELQKATFATLGTHPRGELLFGIAEGYSRLGEEAKARAYFDKLVSDLPGTPYARRAALWIEKKSLPAEQTGCIGCHVPGK